MKTTELKVGIKGAEPVKVPCPQPESVDDILKLARGNQEVVIRWARRGFRIEAQEKSGARDVLRDMVEAKSSQEEIQKAVAAKVAAFDPTVSQPRSSGPRKPKDVKIDPSKTSYTPEEFKALLLSQGVKVNFVDEGAAPTPAAGTAAKAPATATK